MTAAAIRAGVFILATALFGAAAALPALAETVSLKADLKAVAGTNSKASGTLTANYDTDTKKLTWRATYRGVTTYATAAGFYGPADTMVVRLRSVDSPFDGTAILSEKQAADLMAGRWYIVVRTAAFPNGELRGQIARAG